MSKKQAIAFFEEISKNKQLAQEVEKVVGGKNSDETKAKELLSLAKKHNFNFTKEEAASAQVALKKPLSPEEMLEVSGGKLNLKSSVMAAALLLGLGASGAALHSMEASAMDRGNPQEIQAPGGQDAAGRQEGDAQPEQQGADGNQEQPEQQQQGAEGNQERPEQQQQGAEGNQEQPGQQNAPAHAKRRLQVVSDGRRTVDAGHFIELQGPGVLLATGDSDRGLVLVQGDRPVQVDGQGGQPVAVFGDRPVQVAGQGGQPVAVFGDRPVQVAGQGQKPVVVFGDRPVLVRGPGQKAVEVFGDREVQVKDPGRKRVFVNGDRPVQVDGAGATRISRPGGHGVGELPEIFVAPPRLLNPNREPQEAPVYAPRNVFLIEVGTATINGAQQAYINCPCDVTHSAPGGNLRVTGNTMITTEGINLITAGRGSHVISFSVNELNHEGDGAVNIDRGDIVVSSTTMNDILGRNVTIENANAVAVNGAVSLAVTAVGDGGINISSDATVNHSAQHGQINVTGGAVINADGPNRINAHEDTTVASTSANLLTHDGAGGVVIDGGSIEVSGSSLEQVERNVTVTMANSVTVNSGITMRTQNGTEFTMGATREETLDNILDSLLVPHISDQDATTLTNKLKAIAKKFNFSKAEMFAFLRKYVFRGG